MGSLQHRAAAIIQEVIPKDSEKRVKAAVQQYNNAVRDNIRTETGLKLSDSSIHVSVPVRVSDAFPDPFASVIVAQKDALHWWLALTKPQLDTAAKALEALVGKCPVLEQWPHLPAACRGGGETLRGALDILRALQGVTEQERIKQEFREIEEDVLGCYVFGGGEGPHVDIYWLPIALVATMLNVDMQDLAVVVLIHELAHAYSHLGIDIDGAKWRNEAAFFRCNLAVIEGLAQFYTDVISRHLRGRAPGVYIAYRDFLHLQSWAYLAHVQWLQTHGQRCGEIVRFALLAARKHDAVDYNTWLQLLDSASEKLKHPEGGQVTLFESPEDQVSS